MDTTERARLRALCEAATPGPWVTGEGAAGRFMVSTDDGVCCVGGVRRVVIEINDGCAPWRFPDGPIPEAQLIAASRTAIPALLDDLDAADVRASVAERERDVAVARLSRIEAIRDEARATLGAGQGVCYEGLTDAARRVVTERDEARAEVERLRASEASRRELMPALLILVRKVAREEEREACAAIADEYAVDARAIAARCDGRFPATAESARIRAEAAEILAAAIRARGKGGAR